MFGVFGAPVLWTAPVRVALFWLVTALVTLLVYARLAPLGPGEALAIVGEALRGNIARVSTEAFAFTLAGSIAAFAAGLLVAHVLFHAIAVRMAIGAARRVVETAGSKSDFAARHRAIDAALREHPLLGYAWREFDETVIKTEVPFRNTLRPQTFFTVAALREKLAGLKIMSGVPGYFVGIGLLLTFTGLVIALSKAAAGTQAAHLAADGAGAQAMQGALRELLEAATFKFATSIAGLAASIVLSFSFRLITIGLESSLHAFCEAVDGRLDYVPPQAVTMEMRNGIYAQLESLESLTSDAFFSRLGAQVAPSLQAAVAPLTSSIDQAVGQLTTTNRDGVEALLNRFLEGVQGGAGSELKEIGASLRTLHGALDKVRTDMSGSGEDFSRRMSDAAVGASGQMEQAMSRVLSRLESQVMGLADVLAASARAHEGHARAVDHVAMRSGQTAEAFGRSAEAIRAAIEPVGRSNERLIGASEAMGQSAAALVEGQRGAAALAQAVSTQVERLTALWADYEARFGKIDVDLGLAFEKLATESLKQSKLLADQTVRVDAGLAKAVDTLSAHVRSIGSGAEDLAEAVEDLGRVLGARGPAA